MSQIESSTLIPQTILILGTDPAQCAELRSIFQEKTTCITAAPPDDKSPPTLNSETVLSADEPNTSALYRNLLTRLESQVRRARLLSELIQLLSSSLELEELLERIVAKSIGVLGDTAFIVLNAEARLQLEAALSTDRERLIRLLVTTLNVTPQAVTGRLLHGVLEEGVPLLVTDLQQSAVAMELRPFADKYGLLSLVATPIRAKNRILGAFLSMTTAPRRLDEHDLATASELSEFTAMVLENRRLLAELQRLAITDSLTGVFNSRFFHRILSNEAARSHRYGTPLSLLMIDIDTFKLVNDTFGHQVGDKVLVQIGRALEKVVRNVDFIFRCGGDEFGVVLPGTPAEGAVCVGEKILERVQASQILKNLGYSGSITVSIGVSEYRKGAHFESLVAEADHALYAAKRSTKNCVRTYSASEPGTGSI